MTLVKFGLSHMDREINVSKVYTLLCYSVLSSDPLSSITNSNRKLLDRYRRENKFPRGVFRLLRPTNSAMTRFWGLPKIHKPYVPLKPIVALCDTPMFGLAKWLSPLFKSFAAISNKFQLCKKISAILAILRSETMKLWHHLMCNHCLRPPHTGLQKHNKGAFDWKSTVEDIARILRPC